MAYVFTKTDHKILDFLSDNYNDLVFQVEVDSGETVYYSGALKVVLTLGEAKYDD
jgi:hypothetical protein